MRSSRSLSHVDDNVNTKTNPFPSRMLRKDNPRTWDSLVADPYEEDVALKVPKVPEGGCQSASSYMSGALLEFLSDLKNIRSSDSVRVVCLTFPLAKS